MTLKLTERDKKLLVILAVFVLIVGVGAGVRAVLRLAGHRFAFPVYLPSSALFPFPSIQVAKYFTKADYCQLTNIRR